MNLRKYIRGVLRESFSDERYRLLAYSDDYNEDFEEYDLDEYEVYERAHEIAKNGGVTILRDKHLISVLVDLEEKKVIGALWVSQDHDKFSFDIALDSGYQNMGLSSNLIKAAISEYEMQKEMYGDDLKMEVDVINPKLAQILQSKYGFHKVGDLGPNRVLMSLNEELDMVSLDEIRKVVRETLNGVVFESDSKFSDDYDFSKHSFTSGDCDIYAVSLHRLYGYPLYVVRGWYEDDLGEDNDFNYEDCHIVVKMPNGLYLDSEGEQGEQELRQNARFMNDVHKITIVPISEEEALNTFSCQDQEADVQNVMNYIKKRSTLSEENIDYKGPHVMRKDSSSSPLHNLLQSGQVAPDFYENIHHYAYLHNKSDQESVSIIKQARNKPDAIVTIYRAVPKGVTEINTGDWISLSKSYAKHHGLHHEDSKLNMPVISKKVKAKDIWWDGNDVNEFSYFPGELSEGREVEGIDGMTKLSIFDFDKTLVNTPEPEFGASEWEQKTGQKWKGSWWENPNSLDTKIFDMSVNPSVISAYKVERSNPNTLVVMMTGRKKVVEKEVMNILSMKGLKFDDHLFNDGGETLDFKIREIKNALRYNPNIREVSLYDDRAAHLQAFQNLGNELIKNSYLDKFEIYHVKNGNPVKL